MDDELKTCLMQMEERLFNHIVNHVDERIEKVETTLLTEFHKWGSPVDAKLRTHRSWFTEIDAELQLLKARMAKLEGEKPPQ